MFDLAVALMGADLGTCFRQDTQKLQLDGAPDNSIIATDTTPEYWCALWSASAVESVHAHAGLC